jgi:hypothetical protein
LTERWRQPAKIAAVEEDPERIYHDGNVYRRQIDVTYDGDSYARMRLGYLCMRCMEPQESPFPHACSLCGYSMNDLQLRDLAEEFTGVKQVGPSTTIDEEVERLRERKQFERIWTPPSAA